MKPVLRFSKYKDSWIIASFSEFVAEIDSGWSPVCESNPADIDGWGSLKTTAITWDGFKPEENKRLPPELKPKLESEIRKDDILIIRVSPVNRVGVVAHVDTERKRLMVSDNMLRIRLANGLTPEFVPLLCRTSTVRKSWLSKVAGMASAQVVISQKTIRMTKIVIPDLDEQREISTFFAKINLKIHLLTKKKEALEKYKMGLMQKIFSQELRFKREDGTDYPEWKEIVFKEFLNQRSERNKNAKGYEVYSVNNRLGFISQSVQFDGYVVASEDVSNYKLVYPGDIVYNPSRINVGSIAINSTNAIRIVSPLYNVFHVSSYPVTFWYRLQELHIFKHLVKVSCSGSVRDSLSFDDLSNFKMVLPSIEEAVLIENILQKVEHNLSLLEELIKSTLALKTGLIQKMFV